MCMDTVCPLLFFCSWTRHAVSLPCFCYLLSVFRFRLSCFIIPPPLRDSPCLRGRKWGITLNPLCPSKLGGRGAERRRGYANFPFSVLIPLRGLFLLVARHNQNKFRFCSRFLRRFRFPFFYSSSMFIMRSISSRSWAARVKSRFFAASCMRWRVVSMAFFSCLGDMLSIIGSATFMLGASTST